MRERRGGLDPVPVDSAYGGFHPAVPIERGGHRVNDLRATRHPRNRRGRFIACPSVPVRREIVRNGRFAVTRRDPSSFGPRALRGWNAAWEEHGVEIVWIDGR